MQAAHWMPQLIRPLPAPERQCNCQGGVANCPVGGFCHMKGVVYCAIIMGGPMAAGEIYIGMTSRVFKVRYLEHMNKIRNQVRWGGTRLNQRVTQLTNLGFAPTIRWEIIVALGHIPNQPGNLCALCTAESNAIDFQLLVGGPIINGRLRRPASCRHR